MTRFRGVLASHDSRVTERLKRSFFGLRGLPLGVGSLPALYVASIWVASGVSFGAAARAVVLAAFLGILIAVVARVAAPDLPRATLVGLGITSPLLTPRLELGVIVVMLSIAVGLLGSFVSARGDGRFRWSQIPRLMNAVAVGLTGALVVRLLGSVSVVPSVAATSDLRIPASAVARGDLPDVYVLLLDGYLRPDKLRTLYGRDVSSFLRALRSRGFSIAARSRSNYLETTMTLTSMLNMEELSAFSNLRSLSVDDPAFATAVGWLINNNRAGRVFSALGYETVSVSSGWEKVSYRQVDRFIDTGELNEFEGVILQSTLLGEVTRTLYPALYPDQVRSRVTSVFRAMEEIAAEDARAPRFVFAHVPSPHVPIVFNEDGSAVIDERLTVGAEWAAVGMVGLSRFREAWADQVEYVNTLTLRALGQLDSVRRRDVIVYVMSDHGAGSGWDNRSPLSSDLDERTANFLAVYSSEGVGSLITDTTTPVNVFRRLFRIRVGMDLPDLPDTSFAWQGDRRFDIVPINVPP